MASVSAWKQKENLQTYKSTAVPIDALISYENNERLLYSMCRELNLDENPVRKEVITVTFPCLSI